MGAKRRSDGAHRLGAIGRTDEDLAKKIGRKREQVTYWRLGTRDPSAASRELMFKKLAIPLDAWDKFSRGAASGGPGTATDYEPVEDDGSVRAKAQRLDRLARAMLDTIDKDATLTTIERFRLATDVHKLLDSLGKLTGESQHIPEARILRLPAWRRIQDRVIAALRPHRTALAAVLQAIEELGGAA